MPIACIGQSKAYLNTCFKPLSLHGVSLRSLLLGIDNSRILPPVLGIVTGVYCWKCKDSHGRQAGGQMLFRLHRVPTPPVHEQMLFVSAEAASQSILSLNLAQK
jgi:hypothetical protein